jgi:hypothetical protein
MNLNTKPSKGQNITSSTQITTGPGMLTGIFVSAASATPTIKVWDSLTASGTVLLDTFTPTAGQSYYFTPLGFSTGCYVTISGTVSCTIMTSK